MSDEKQKPSCFVIMPFGESGTKEAEHSLSFYTHLLKPIIEFHGYTTIRADEIDEPGSITHDIVLWLFKADLVVADLTGGNPNVFYELGIRHALKRTGTIPIVEKGSSLPFDVRDYRAIFYSTDPKGAADFRKDLGRKIEALKAARRNRRPDNPVHNAIGDQLHFRALSEDETDYIKKSQIIDLMMKALNE